MRRAMAKVHLQASLYSHPVPSSVCITSGVHDNSLLVGPDKTVQRHQQHHTNAINGVRKIARSFWRDKQQPC